MTSFVLIILGERRQSVKSNSLLREGRMDISDVWNTFSYTPDMGILWYIIIFLLKLGVFSQISFFQKKFLYQKFFLKFFEKNFFALNSFLGWFMAKKKFSKKFQKKFWPKKIRNFFQNLICEKVPSLSQKMMIYHKMPMSGVYENVF